MWARAYGPSVAFACVCVDESAAPVAALFQREQGFRSAINVYIDRRENLPRFPAQLGCQGFVVLDAKKKFVTTCTTPALMRAGPQLAFGAVERLLKDLLVKDTGKSVTLHGLSKLPELNGTRVAVLPDQSTVAHDRIAVRLQDGRVIAVKRDNVVEDGSATDGSKRHKTEAPAPPPAPVAATVFDKDACCAPPRGEQLVLPRVGHKGMDAEHDDLSRVMQDIMQGACMAKDMECLRDMFEEHSAHEEKLMERIGFGGGQSDAFSAAASHAKDHRRILELADDALAQLDEDGSVPRAKAGAVIDAIVRHAESFDSLYADAIAAAA